MNKEERERKEKELEDLRNAADAATQSAAAQNFGDESLNAAADKAEEAVKTLEEELKNAPSDPEATENSQSEDINFEDEERKLHNQPAPDGKSDREKAERALYFQAKQVQRLGGDPSTVLGIQPPQTPPPQTPPATPPADTADFDSRYVTKEDMVKQEVRRLSRSESEFNVVMHHYHNSIRPGGDARKDAESAYLFAHQGRIRRSFDEIRRTKFAPPQKGPSGPGAPTPAEAKAPDLSAAEIATLKRRKFTQNADGTWSSKRHTLRFDTKHGWITERNK